ncbi:MAG TPA: M20/M25/M40 family metallo-hydrolase, partial [Acidimicrobiales bacterium]|nr:M20/M25/M40 family metallo-hydrolase [Acidimicrobiales bacterium]
VTVKLLVEGEEESGSPHFEALLTAEAERQACVAVVVSDTGMWAPETPSICVGMRGLVAFDITVTTGTIDLHSGSFGGGVPNAAHVLASLVAGLHDEEGRVALPGFYDDVAPLTRAEADSLAALPFDEASWREAAGVGLLTGEAGRSTLERIWTRPTCEVVGITVGYGGPGTKTIVPATGTAKVTFRLVPAQHPDTVEAAFAAWVADQVPAGTTVEVARHGGVAPVLSPLDHPAMTALARAIEAVWGTPPLLAREGGSGPEEALGRVLATPVVFLGVGLPGDRIHAPNERLVMDQFWKGLLAAGELWLGLGAPGDR